MNRFATTVLIIFMLAAIASAASLGGAVSDDASPSGQFFSSALLDQITASGSSLDVEYTTVKERLQKGVVLERSEKTYHYVRTADASRIETIRDGKVAEEAFVDRKRGQYRLLSYEAGRRYAVDGQGIGQPFVNSEFFETSLYLLDKKPLYERTAKASSIEKEVVDGHECFRVQIPSDVPRPLRYVVWLDPTIACNPRRIDVVHDEGRVTVIKFDDYKSVGPSGWFPMKMTMQYRLSKDDWDFRITSAVTKIASGGAVSTEKLRPVFPSGTVVYAGGGEYIQP